MIRSRTLGLTLLIALPSIASAQRGAVMKRGLPVVAAQPSCPSIAAPTPVAEAQRRTARDLAQRAQQSAILGDRTAARDQLRQAAILDPANADLAYQSARAMESAGSPGDAVGEYCRFVTLAPNAPEASEARERIASLSRTGQTKVAEQVLAPFRAGIAAYEAGRLGDAEASFTAAIRLQPDWADAYYDRALTYAARGARDLAVRDLQQYLRLRPEADDRSAVASRIQSLAGGSISPGAAFAYGLVIPGAGQMYTGRKTLGIVALGAAVGAYAFAVKTDPVDETYLATGELPFGGGTYTYPVTRTVVGRPHLVAGLAAAGAIAATSAVEAYLFARRVNLREPRVSAALVPATEGVALRLTLR